MYVILLRSTSHGSGLDFHVVNDNGRREFSSRTMQELLRRLVDAGELSVVAMTDIGPELFLIEPCEGLALTLPALSLRRQHYGRCCEAPPLPGIGGDPTLRARVEDPAWQSPAERTRRRLNWVRRATGLANDDIPA